VVLRSRDGKKRRLGFAAAVVAAGVLFAGGIAFAASQTIVGQGDNTFSASTYTTDQGAVVQLNVTGSDHNVTANQAGPDGKALFRSPTISPGTTSVQGTQYLSAGSYTFFCSVHPTTMQATLVVTGNGTPQPRPSATLSVRSKKISKVSKKGLLVAINATAKVDDVSLVAKLGKATIGKVDGLSLSSGQQFAKLKLTKSGKHKLASKSKASVTVTAAIPFGAPASAKTKLT
jgi:plastocyanin